jgi:hypothetical protein
LWILEETERIIATPAFQRRRRAVETALHTRLSLSESEVAELLR